MSPTKTPKKILVISHDKVGPNMAGPGIRYHRIASTLSKKHEVTLAVFNPTYIEGIRGMPYKAIDIHVQKFQEVFSGFDVVVALWLSDEMIAYAKSKGIVVIFDLYAPVPVEDLVQRVFGGRVSPDSDHDYGVMLANYRHFIQNGDFCLVSNEQQRDFWMGYAFASDKTSPSKQKKLPIDESFGICPMGIELSDIGQLDEQQDLLSQRIPSISKSDFVIVWTGGIWDWFDAITPIRSIASLAKKGNKNIKLIFLGTKHPNDDVPAMQETEDARQLARKLQVLDKQVYFLDGWLPYNDRIGYLKRADAALYAHKPSIESRFSHRTRVLDHILMSLPTIATRGDYFADYIELHELGICVDPFDTSKMTEAIITLATDKKLTQAMRSKITATQPIFTWDTTLQPLSRYLEQPVTASPYMPRLQSTATTSIASAGFKRVKELIPRSVKQAIKRALY